MITDDKKPSARIGAKPQVGHSRPQNDLLMTAKAMTQSVPYAPHAKPLSVSLYDMPRILRACIEAMRFWGIGRVAPRLIICLPGQAPIIEIRYFRALDAIEDAQWAGSSRGHDGSYDVYELDVGGLATLRWQKAQSIYSRLPVDIEEDCTCAEY